MKYQLAAIDLDGTLLNSKTHKISVANALAVKRALSNNVIVVLASGRQHETIAAFAAELHIPQSTPLISYNGAMIRTLAGETWEHQPVPAEYAQAIVHFCAEHNYHLNYYYKDTLYVRYATHWGETYQSRTGSVPRVTYDLLKFDGCQPTKLLLIDTKDVTDSLLIRFQNQFGGSLYITKTEDEYLEFMAPDVSKGNALTAVSDRLKIAQDQCAAFGDSFNDISMLEWAGLGIAMMSGRPEAISAADIIAPNADDNGVGILLDQLFSTST